VYDSYGLNHRTETEANVSGTLAANYISPNPFTVEPPKVEVTGLHFCAPPTTAPAVYHCTTCPKPFQHAFDWKRHEKTFHERFEIWKCPDCPKEFGEATKFRTHHQFKHSCKQYVPRNFRHAEGAHKVLIKKMAWGCGFCGKPETSWERRCNHVARHFERDWHHDNQGKGVRGREGSEWDVSLVIRGLLEREEVAAHCDDILAQNYPIERQNGEELGNMLRWSPHELVQEETQALISSLQCPIRPEEAYSIVYSLIAMTLPRESLIKLTFPCETIDITTGRVIEEKYRRVTENNDGYGRDI